MNKQIEEKKKIIADICPFYKEYGSCDQCNKALDIDNPPCYWECMANEIIRNNYRKQIVGEWIKVINHIECSKCGYKAPYKKIKAGYHLQDLANYCPNCGAKMKGGAK